MKSTRIGLILILLGLLFCSVPIFGQVKFDLEEDFNARYQIKSWNANNYAFSNSVLSVIQNDVGHIWIGTFEGLYKFDGLDFKRIDLDRNHEHLFLNYTFWSILEDSKKNIWFGSNGGGIVIYDIKEKKYKKLQDKKIQNEIIISLFEDSQGIIWAGTRKHLLKIKNQKVEIIRLKDFPTLAVRSFCEDKNGILWLGTQDNGLLAIQNEKIVQSYNAKAGLLSNQVYSLFIDNQNTFWVGTTKGLFILNDDKLTAYPLASIKTNSFPVITSFYQKKNTNTLWIGTEEGLVHLKNKTQSFVKHLPDNRITSINKDKEGNIWVGTYHQGLVRLKKSEFLSYKIANGLVNEVVNCVFEDKQKNIWIGTNEGLSVWNDNTFTNYTTKDGLAGNRVRDFSSAEDRIWIATYGGLSYCKNGKITPFEANSKLQNNRIRAVFYDKETKNLWIGSSQGLHCYTAEKEMLIYGDTELGNANIMSIAPTSKGLAIGTNGGGLIFYKDGKFDVITSQEGLSGNVVFDVFEDKQNNFWIATNGGMTLLQGEKMNIFRATDGFHSNVIFQTLEDEAGKLWFTCNKSIFYFDKQHLLDFAAKKRDKLHPRLFTTNDGLPSNVTGASKGFKTQDNWLTFPCLKGLALIKPADIQKNDKEPKVYIEEIDLDGQALENIGNRLLNISPETRRINIFYTALSYSDPQKIVFKYRLFPFEKEWIETDAREVSYTSLPIGKYTFQLTASNGNGVWNEKALEIQLEQKGYFYNNYLFYPFLLLFFGIVAFIIYRYRLARYIESQFRLERLVSKRTAKVEMLAQEIQYSLTKVSDSIRYAKRIQDAILYNDEIFKSTFESFFMIWRAKDVVSGDFYWSQEKDGKAIIAVGDCTGHGVPGAFMTILGSSTLDKIVHKGISEPAKILQILDREIYASVEKKDDNTKNSLHEGMDISICIFDYQKKEFSFAGAKSQALFFHDTKMIRLNGDKTSIGAKWKMPIIFQTQTFEFEKGDRLYLFSDGFADQFGGENNTKYLIKRLRKFIKKIQNTKLTEQRQILLKELDDWQGNKAQIDDIIFIGIEL